MSTPTIKLNAKSPAFDHNGRSLYRVTMTDGIHMQNIFLYAFTDIFAIEKAKANNPYLFFKKARLVNQKVIIETT